MENIVDILNDLRIPFRREGEHHHTSRGWVNIDCPWCSPNSQKFRMGYSQRGRFFNCWVCGSHNIIKTFGELVGEEKSDIWRRIMALPRSGNVFLEKSRGTLIPPVHKPLFRDPTIHYLRDRKVQSWDIQKWKIEEVTSHWGIYLPIYYRGEEVSWTTRSIGDRKIYKKPEPNEEVYPASTLLYGEDFARHTIIVVEGPFDAIRLGPGAVALLGSHASPQQLRRIASYPNRVIALDNDEAGRNGQKQLLDSLSPLTGVTHDAQWSSGKDASEASEWELSVLRKYAGLVNPY